MRIFQLVSSLWQVSGTRRVDEEPDLTRRLLLTGVAAVVATGVIAVTVPSTAEAGRRHRRRRSEDRHSRRRSDRDRHRRDRSDRYRHGRRRSGDGWNTDCFWLGPVMICD